MRPVTIGLWVAASLLSVPFTAWAGESIQLHVKRATGADDLGNRPALNLELTPDSKDAFGVFTTKHVGKMVDLKIDGKAVMSPVVRDPILGGQLMVSGNFERSELAAIAKRIEAADARVEAEVADR